MANRFSSTLEELKKKILPEDAIGIFKKDSQAGKVLETFKKPVEAPVVKKFTETFTKEAPKAAKQISEAAISPGKTFIEPGLKGTALQGIAPAIGLGLDILAPGPGELKGAGRAVKEVAEDSVSKLINAIKSAGKPQKELEIAQTAERARRAGEVGRIFEKGEGETGYKKALGALKGELTERPTFEPIKLDTADVTDLFNRVQSHGRLDVYEKIGASNGLDKILHGQLPQPSQLSLLEDVFGRELVEEILNKRGSIAKIMDGITEIANVPRALITTLDASAVLNQGVLFTVTKPKIALGALKEMVKQTFSQKNFDVWLDELPKHPLYKEMKSSGLYIANPGKIAGGLAAREEAFMTNIAQKIPIIGSIIRASERSYVSYLNKMRVDVFTQLQKQFQKDGIADGGNLRSLATFINNATGRGDLRAFKGAAQALNTIFFSPRLIAARFNMLDPTWYAQQTPAVRKEAIKTMGQFIGTGMTVLSLIKLAGGDDVSVEADPRSTDFGKVRIGNITWEAWGGFQQWVRVFSQLVTSEKKTRKGEIIEISKKKFPFESRLDVAERFLKGKLAPVPSLIVELMEGQKTFGGAITLQNELVENTVPLYLQDMGEVIRELGPEGILTTGIPAFFGTRVQVYQEKPAKNRF